MLTQAEGRLNLETCGTLNNSVVKKLFASID